MNEKTSQTFVQFMNHSWKPDRSTHGYWVVTYFTQSSNFLKGVHFAALSYNRCKIGVPTSNFIKRSLQTMFQVQQNAFGFFPIFLSKVHSVQLSCGFVAHDQLWKSWRAVGLNRQVYKRKTRFTASFAERNFFFKSFFRSPVILELCVAQVVRCKSTRVEG